MTVSDISNRTRPARSTGTTCVRVWNACVNHTIDCVCDPKIQHCPTRSPPNPLQIQRYLDGLARIDDSGLCSAHGGGYVHVHRGEPVSNSFVDQNAPQFSHALSKYGRWGHAVAHNRQPVLHQGMWGYIHEHLLSWWLGTWCIGCFCTAHRRKARWNARVSCSWESRSCWASQLQGWGVQQRQGHGVLCRSNQRWRALLSVKESTHTNVRS